MTENAATLDDTLATHVLEVMLRGAEHPDPTVDRGKDKVLEVVQVFGDAVVDLKHFAAGRAVSLGATLVRGLGGTRMVEDFFVPTSLLPAATHPLFEADGNGWVAVLSPSWGGFVEGPAGRRAIPTLAALVTPGADGLVRLPIGPDDRAVIEVGGTTFVARPVHPSRRAPVYGGDGIDYPLLGIAGFMGFVAVMLGVALSVIPSPPKSSRNADDDRLVAILLERPIEAPVPPQASGESGAKAKGPEGKVGEEKAKDPVSRSPLAKRANDADVAKEAGILGALDDNPALNSMLGESTLAGAVADGVGALIGPRATQIGAGGLGSRSGGFGGNGSAEGMGSFGPSGKGRGDCVGCNGFGAPVTRSPDRGDIRQIDDEGIILGSLDKAQIDAVIKRNLSQIKYCYQRELNKNPSLGGKVTVKFVIAKDGSVSSASTKTSTLANAAAESCINGRFMRFAFPQPRGGGIVVVSYPFLFAPS